MTLEPLSDNVCIEPQEEAETRIGAIIVPDTAKEQPQIGTVIAAGPGKRGDDGERRPLAVKTGDTVIYSKYGGTEFDMDGTEYRVMRESDILAIVS
ncbi:co-chaperone GroES [Candidatus Poribacteria bacterium]|jgi:chaperonin GroES|nr:co-chaperone GroES [Candidatus Poribacteria bacterium]MBT5536545.1 co-chaperone GroES [Candidatus Poribacteria bacterium]MBT7100443.1 co-chaperone GroES [Candidatus Poribacteria bacterium]MBT7804766.1 co-chaperone GroES [Candidatus Poribacteria bacterium]